MSTRDLGSAIGVRAVTPSDTTVLPITRGLWVGVSGNVRAKFEDGSVETLNAAAAGMAHPLRVTMVYATGTTATDIVALY